MSKKYHAYFSTRLKRDDQKREVQIAINHEKKSNKARYIKRHADKYIVPVSSDLKWAGALLTLILISELATTITTNANRVNP